MPDPPTAVTRSRPKQAIVVVHGMGEQRPMDTIKGFVDAVWRSDPSITRDGSPDAKDVWSKPDERSGSLELRRLTTRESAPSPGVFATGVRSDFFELYWADLTAGTSWEEFKSWLWVLLLRNPVSNVPRSVLLAWLVLWFLTIIFVVTGIIVAIPPDTHIFGWHVPDFGHWRWLVIAGMAALVTFVHTLIQKTFGRVARYTRATPSNIAARKAVRERGLELLTNLNNDTSYDRIILVGHSLGSIVAYELLAFLWARQSSARQVTEGTKAFEALAALESCWPEASDEKCGPAARAAWDDAQRALRRELARRPLPSSSGNGPNPRWIISDFITLGSPLTHAEFLMASDRADLAARQAAREMPTAPPTREVLDNINVKAALATERLPVTQTGQTSLFCFPRFGDEKTWEMHHAAPFAVVRWTNIYDFARFIYQGDLISGPLQPIFGNMVRDVNLMSLRGQSKKFSHTLYWDKDADRRQLEALRSAVNLLDQPI